MKNAIKLGASFIMTLGIIMGGAGMINVHADDTAPNYDPKEPPLDSPVTPYYDPKEPPLESPVTSYYDPKEPPLESPVTSYYDPKEPPLD